jgi:hypothetical protein
MVNNPMYCGPCEFFLKMCVLIFIEPCGFCLILSICDGSDALAKKIEGLFLKLIVILLQVSQINNIFTPSRIL